MEVIFRCMRSQESRYLRWCNRVMISPFEYIIVLISIILGMGITQVLTGVAGMIMRWDYIKTYWPHTVLILLVFVFHIQEWWVTYELRSYTYWRLPVFLFIILYPVNLYMLARIIFPLRWRSAAMDMRAFYNESSRKVFTLIMSLSILSIVQNLTIGDETLLSQVGQFIVALTTSVVVFFNIRQERIHQVVIVAMLLATVIAFAVQWDVLLIVNNNP